MRVRQFIMKDSYTFDMDRPGWTRRTRSITGLLPHFRALRLCIRWWTRTRRHGRQPVARVHGGLGAGEDLVAVCPGCGYAANLEKAAAVPSQPPLPTRKATWSRRVSHAGRKTIAEVAEFTGLPETSQMKSLVLVADGKPVLVMLRGDHQLSVTKLGPSSTTRIPAGAS